ncbi:MAG: SdpI family protein [Flavobacteriaceae bacterium]|nr:SdpI family protein [Flavobacteriaceae bacterium]MDH3795336.1 SdpI family protein [Flavobacteriaceae bacterium]
MDIFFWITIGQGLLLTLIGVIYAQYPPKKINPIYGYRTKRTMANQTVWDYANKIGAQIIIWTGLICTAMGAIVYFIYPNTYAVIITSALVVMGLILGMILCEKDLNSEFDKKGNRKSKP